MSFQNFIPTVWSAQMLTALKNDNVAVRLSDARYRADAKYGAEIKINGVTVWKNGRAVRNKVARLSAKQPSDQHLSFDVRGGSYRLIAVQ